ncbi:MULTISPECIES: TIGR00266 family protein [Acidianus]|uniref:Transcriptional regulator n=1 Tax=Candidatus Acidianus copahuensis TaxID=1160895 RepID=A0A031LS17_9CREN|nr:MULTISPECIES: TIGR00266 family protein [Acidianus]EZQ10581.1 transcriptional regulator [Candidatus Acidianus copahuensis]NON63326.1 TIGR00266 family protein [Acidianus sp. RZ1]
MAIYQIIGEDMQYLQADLLPQDLIYGEPAHLVSKDFTVSFEMKMRGGLLKALGRALTGSDFFVTEVKGPGKVTFSGFLPGKIIEIPLNNSSLLVEHSSFLAAESSVEYGATLARLTAGILGGEGLFMAKFSGSGRVWIHAVGGVITRYLNPGEKIQIEASHLLAFNEGMRYGIARVGGLKTMLLSGLEGEGIFFVEIEGPGMIWAHAVSRLQLAASIAKMIPHS